MWKCPRCQREFARVKQGHFCGKPKDIEEYIMSQDETVRERLRVIRRIIGEAIPEAAEKISWSMPTYWKGLERVSKCKSAWIMQEEYGCKPDGRKRGSGKRAYRNGWRPFGTPRA